MSLNAEQIVRQAFDEARAAIAPVLAASSDDAKTVGKLFAELERDQLKLFARLQTETDPEKLRELQDAVALELPARRDAILAAAASVAGSTARATFDAALGVLVTVLVAAAKKFLL